jgi:mitogen-activated protein kinase 15
LHSAQIIHRDLKTSNILVNSACEGTTLCDLVKICDFGLVRSLIHEEDAELVLSEDVATRWYRSPEMLLGCQNYGKATDIWSLGCIIAELAMGEPIFPGSSTLQQLEKIIEFTGIPTKDCLETLNSSVAESVISQIKVKKRSLKSYLGDCD